MNKTGYLRHIRACNNPMQEPFIPWTIGDKVVGWLRPRLVEQLHQRPAEFKVKADGVRMNEQLRDMSSRTRALAEVVEWLAGKGMINPPMGESYPVTATNRAEALCVIDRSAAAYFGVRAFGQHLNGYVRKSDGMYMWLGRRAKDRLIFPGALDNMVAGGLPWDVTLEDNLIKEGEEEAGLPAHITRQAVPVGLVSYNRITERGLRPDILYCYDLELSSGFEPQNTDGEVESFSLLPITEVAGLVKQTDEFKLNCNLVIIDFLLRHGYIDPQDEEYLELVIGLRQQLGTACLACDR